MRREALCSASVALGADGGGVVGALASVPLGVYFRSKKPVLYCALSGTMLDLLNSQRACGDKRRALEEYLQQQKEGTQDGDAGTQS